VGHGLQHEHHGCTSFLWKNLEANFGASCTLIKLFHIEFQFCIGKTIMFYPITPTHSTPSFTCYTSIGMAMLVQKGGGGGGVWCYNIVSSTYLAIMGSRMLRGIFVNWIRNLYGWGAKLIKHLHTSYIAITIHTFIWNVGIFHYYNLMIVKTWALDIGSIVIRGEVWKIQHITLLHNYIGYLTFNLKKLGQLKG
jgi:hypothetical protein